MKSEKKTDFNLRRDQSRFEIASQASGIVVFIGLILEVGLAVEYHPDREPSIQTWGAVVSDVLVAGGVFFEIMFSRWALHQSAELQQRAEHALTEATNRAGRAVERAAEANERTAGLEKEAADARGRVADIERLTAYRHISDEQAKIIIEALRPIADTLDVFIEYQTGDPEAWSFTAEIGSIFQEVNVKDLNGRPNSFPLETTFGVFLSGLPESNPPFIVECFAKGHVEIIQRAHNPLWMAPKRPIPNLRMFVGPKPPAAFLSILGEVNSSPPEGANEITARLERDASETQQNLAEARSEILRLQLPRRFNNEKFLKRLEGVPKAEVEILFDLHASDGSVLAVQLMNLLRDAGWGTFIPKIVPPTPGITELPPVALTGAAVAGVTVIGHPSEPYPPPETIAFGALWRAVLEGLELLAGNAPHTFDGVPQGTLRVVIAPRV